MNIVLLLLMISTGLAQDLIGSISDAVINDDRKMIKELSEVFTGQIKLKELPNQRSINYVMKGKLDFHYPILLPLSNVKRKFDYAFSAVTVSTVVYAVYINKANEKIGVHNLQDYLIEGESGHVDFFDFKVVPSSCVECSFKKVSHSRIDGYIYPAVEGDEIISKLKLKNIGSYYFDTYEVKFALPLNAKGQKTDRLLSNLFEKMQKKENYKLIYQEMNKNNKNWRPSLVDH
jgi:hypothetical protein